MESTITRVSNKKNKSYFQIKKIYITLTDLIKYDDYKTIDERKQVTNLFGLYFNMDVKIMELPNK